MREVLFYLSRLFGPHPLQRSASASPVVLHNRSGATTHPYCPTQRLCPKTTATTPHPRLGFLSARRHPNQPRTFQPCAGTSVASVSSFTAGASQIIIIRPAAFVQRTGKTTSAGLRSVRLRGKGPRLWCRQQDLNLRTRKFFISELYPPSFCLHIAPSGRSRSPAHQEKKGEKKKNGDAEFAPAPPRYHIFFCCCISLCNIT